MTEAASAADEVAAEAASAAAEVMAEAASAADEIVAEAASTADEIVAEAASTAGHGGQSQQHVADEVVSMSQCKGTWAMSGVPTALSSGGEPGKMISVRREDALFQL